MLWKVAIHGGHIHPDFIRGKLTERQLYEIAWYFEENPFGHEIDHMMIARLISAWAGGRESDYMPRLQEEPTLEDRANSMPGLGQFMNQYGIEVEDERN